VGPERFVVDFRHGRRGAVLRQGTRTPRPVGRAEGEALFERLVAEQEAKGYVREDAEGAAAAAPAAPASPVAPPRLSARQGAALLSALEARDAHTVDRAIWRCGELALREAAPRLVRLIGSGGPVRD